MALKLVTSESYVNNIRNFLPEKPNSKTPTSEKSKRIFDKVIDSPNFIFDKSDKKITDYITTLLSIRPGRTLFKQLLKADKPLKIVRDSEKGSCFKPDESTVILNDSKVTHLILVNPNGEKLFASCVPAITLAHELVHALHYFEDQKLFIEKLNSNKNIIDPDLDDLEEQETIIGKEEEGTLCENVFLFNFGYHLRVNHQAVTDTSNASQCARYGTLANLKELLLSDPSLINLPQCIDGNEQLKLTPLFAAILYNQMEIVDYLFQIGVDVNAQDAHFGTALHAAVATKKSGLVRVLLEKGAKPDLRSPKGTALQLALREKNDEMVEILAPVTNLKQKIRGNFLLNLEFNNASPEGIRTLIRHGADINSKSTIGNTPLMHCCDSTHTNIEETKLKFAILLEHEDLDLEAKNTSGESALSLAVKKGHLWQVDALVKKGAEIPPHLKKKIEKYIEWYKKGTDVDWDGRLWKMYEVLGMDPINTPFIR